MRRRDQAVGTGAVDSRIEHREKLLAKQLFDEDAVAQASKLAVDGTTNFEAQRGDDAWQKYQMRRSRQNGLSELGKCAVRVITFGQGTMDDQAEADLPSFSAEVVSPLAIRSSRLRSFVLGRLLNLKVDDVGARTMFSGSAALL